MLRSLTIVAFASLFVLLAAVVSPAAGFSRGTAFSRLAPGAPPPPPPNGGGNSSTNPAVPLDLKAWRDKRVLFISAHPDDIEASAGGTIAHLSAQGTEVFYLIATNGNKGCGSAICAGWSAPQIAAQRRIEAINAARVLGVPEKNLMLMNYGDGELTSYPTAQVKAAFIATIRKFRPHIVMSWWPYPRFEMKPSDGWADLGFHPDHQAAGRYALETHFESGLALLMPELGHEAWTVEQFYMWDFITPSQYVDISSTLDIKIKSWLEHKTQYPNATMVTNMLTKLGQVVASYTNTNVRYAEGFQSFF